MKFWNTLNTQVTGHVKRQLDRPTSFISSYFGQSIAMSADGDIVAVGAPRDRYPATSTETGCVYIFDGNGNYLHAFLNPNGPVYGDKFGSRLAMSANGNSLLVTAPGTTVAGQASAGIAYLYDPRGAYMSHGPLENPFPGAGDWFGASVTMSSDGLRFAIAAPYDVNDVTTYAGTVYVYESGDEGTANAIYNPEPASGDSFGGGYDGNALAMSGDGSKILVGAPADDYLGYSNTGSAYVFNGVEGSLICTLRNPTLAADDRFGYAVALSQDGAWAYVGAPRNNVGGIANAGSVYVFNALTGALVYTFDHSGLGSFGSSISITRDNQKLLIGAPSKLNVGYGTVYVYDLVTKNLLGSLNNPSAGASSFSDFQSVAANGDGTQTIVGNASDPGVVRVF